MSRSTTVKTGIKKHSNIIAIIVVAALVTGQDAYLFSIVGPAIDLRTGPEGIRDAQIFNNFRSTIITIITHGLLLAIILVLLIRPPPTIIYMHEGQPTAADSNEK